MEVDFNIKDNNCRNDNKSKGEVKESNHELHVAKLDLGCWVVGSIEDLPWHVIMGVYENLGPKDLVCFMMTSRAVRGVVWDNELFWRRHFERCFGRYIPRSFGGLWRAAFLATASSGLSRVCPNARVYAHMPSLEPQHSDPLAQEDSSTPSSSPAQRSQQGQEAEGWFHRVRRLERRMASFFNGAEGGGGNGAAASYARRADDITTILVGVLGPGGSGKTEVLRVNQTQRMK